MTKGALVASLAGDLSVAAKDVRALLDRLAGLAAAQLAATGQFTIPDVLTLKAVRKPAQPEREGVDPFTKQPKTFKARPASVAVKARVAKKFKDAVAAGAAAAADA